MIIKKKSRHNLGKVLFVGNYLPRRCGIATFTTDLAEAVGDVAPDTSCQAIAMNDVPWGYKYPSRVCFEVEASQREQYDMAADYINLSRPDVVCVQHEYGIYGGKAGRYIIPMVRQLKAPLVSTLHTILKEPDEEQKRVLAELAEVSDRVVVMSLRGKEFLQKVYGIPEGKVAFIHHGIPDTPFIDPNYYKDKFDAEGRPVLLTFGLLSPNKGIEYAIDAVAEVVKEFPNVLYIVLGATHPHVKQERGEEYRHKLLQRVRENGLTGNVTFVNRFVSLEELCEYLGAADIYITPYLNEEQITSGTLAYAVGTGKAVVSTPYWYANEMLADGRGCIVPFHDSAAMAETLKELLRDERKRHAIRRKAYRYGRLMAWPEVARKYLELFEEVRRERMKRPKPAKATLSSRDRFENLPNINPGHMLALTDSTGIMQHALFSVPDPRHGYSTDDQARAIIVAVKAAELAPNHTDWNMLASRYLSYLVYAFDEESRRFGNFLSYQHTWAKPVATEDVHARALWGLAHVVAFSSNRGHSAMAAHLFERAITPALSFTSPRPWAFTLLAIQTYLRRYSGATTYRREREVLARQLMDQFESNASSDWPWLEDRLTYANARIPHAMIEAGQWLQDDKMVAAGLESLAWLDKVQTSESGHFVPVGSNGWFPRGGTKARFDQQPLEAAAMLEACVAAYRLTSEEVWLSAARRSFEWFLGRNDLGLPLYEYATGACHDGLQPDRLNENQGAESTIAWLMSLLLMYELQEEVNIRASDNQESITDHERRAQPHATPS